MKNNVAIVPVISPQTWEACGYQTRDHNNGETSITWHGRLIAKIFTDDVKRFIETDYTYRLEYIGIRFIPLEEKLDEIKKETVENDSSCGEYVDDYTHAVLNTLGSIRQLLTPTPA